MFCNPVHCFVLAVALLPAIAWGAVDDGRHCFPGVCKNGSKCKLNSLGKVYCARCPSKYTGSRCQTLKPVHKADDGHHCFTGVCKNGSKCKLNGVGKVYCVNCPSKYTGNRCEKVNTGPCSTSPCKNGSTCSQSSGTYICSCVNNFGGKNCEVAPVKCVEAKGESACGGSSGPSGPSADTKCCPSSEDCIDSCGATSCSRVCITKNRPKTCEPNPCKNGNPCFFFQEGPQCQCQHGEQGLFCETAAPV